MNNVCGISEAARRTCWSAQTLRGMCKRGEIPAQKVGKAWAIDEKWVRENVVPKGYVILSQYAKNIGVSRQAIHDKINRGKIPVLRRGPRKWFVPEGSHKG